MCGIFSVKYLHIYALCRNFVENFPHIRNHMDKFNIELKKIIDAAVTSSINIDDFDSLKELYDSKKKMLGLSDRQIQKILGIDAKTINPILNGTAKQINFINIVKLSHFLGISVNDMAKVYVPDLSIEQISEIQSAREAGYIVENFDVATLTKARFFQKDSSARLMAERIKRFFAFDSLYDYSKNSIIPAYSRTKRSSDDLMRIFWVQSALTQFKIIANPNIYDRQALLNLIPKIKPFSRDVKNGLIKVLKALYRVGVTVIYQHKLEKVQVRGATMIVDGKPCIVLSDLYQSYPTLWFTLLHELYHVLYDFDDIKNQTYHISDDEGDLFLINEEKANIFARNYFVNESRMKFAKAYIRSDFHIKELANKWGIHSSLIYAIHCYETEEWALYNKYIPSSKETLDLINTHPFEQDCLIESVNKLKEILNV